MSKQMSQPNAIQYTLPIVALLDVQEEWQVSMSSGVDPEFSFERTSSVAYRRVDSFDVRDDFLNRVRSPDDALRFFRSYGPFQITPDTASGLKMGKAVRVEPVRWSVLQRAQEDFRDALEAEGIPVTKRWLYELVFGRPLKIELWYKAIVPDPAIRTIWRAAGADDAAIAMCADVVDALRSSIFLSRMAGFTWKRCARKGCDKLFQPKTARQIYCDERCAHLQAVRAHNARKKKPSTKTGKRKNRKGGKAQ